MSASAVVLTTYVAVLAVLSLNGAHRLWLLWELWRAPRPPAPAPMSELPAVTVQLPMFNESHVAQRLVRAAGALRYPRERLEIQVLDDSTDETTSLASAAVAELVAQGIDAVLLHRDDRTGFKAGALDAGLRIAKGELIAVFDADFVPEPSFLEQVVPHFAPGIGMVQARWGHLNARSSWLTAAQATLLDGHFVVEHTARHASGRWFNFNGTAGVWRRQAIEDGGGWQHDTLTEDLDLSYRAQLAGWRFRYLPDVVAPAELPPDMPSFKAQQHRWAKGSIQTARKLLARIWRAPIPVGVKLEATVHLVSNVNYPLVLVLSVLLPWAVQARSSGEFTWLGRLDLVVFGLAVVPFFCFYGVAIARSGSPGRVKRWVQLPVALALGLGMAVAQSRAVWDALSGPVGVFVRTPKVGAHDGVVVARVRGTVRWSPVVVAEIALGAYLVAALVLTAMAGNLASLPWVGLLAAGYLVVGLGSLRARVDPGAASR